jgi:hypothetical protein
VSGQDDFAVIPPSQKAGQVFEHGPPPKLVYH